MKKKIAIVDPSSYSLPYDYFYIQELSKYFIIDFYYSKTSNNYEYIERLSNNKNVRLFEYKISPNMVSKVKGVVNYVKLLFSIYRKRKSYSSIHFIWSIFILLEILLFISIKKKIVFTVHNDVPHGYKGKRYFPYSLIKRTVSTLVFVSKYTMQNFIRRYGNHKNMHLVQHGLMPLSHEFTKLSVDNSLVEHKLIFWGRVEDYKGVDLFDKIPLELPIDIYGRWSRSLDSLKNNLLKKNNINIVDSYLSLDELSDLLKRQCIYILPYKDATQSGVLYTLLAYEKVFISSNVGENHQFLIENNLEALSFSREDPKSLLMAIEYAFSNHQKIKEKLRAIKEQYQWHTTLSPSLMNRVYR